MRVGIVGGSIAGAAAAVLIARQGHQVVVFERSQDLLEERGGGIVLPVKLVEKLKEIDLLDESVAGIRPSRQTWLVRDGSPGGRVISTEHLGSLEAFHWGGIYRQLMSRTSDVQFHLGKKVTETGQDADRAWLRLEDGSEESFEFLLGADGYRSSVRRTLFPDAKSIYAGYVAWRGIVDESILEDSGFFDEQISWPVTPHGHAPHYFVPGKAGEREHGQRRLNWLWYDADVPREVLTIEIDDEGNENVAAIQPGKLSAAQREYLVAAARRDLPGRHADVISRTPEPYLQSVFDLDLEEFSRGRIALAGDAASIARPHTASGSTKALQDAIALMEALVENEDPIEALTRYSTSRAEEAHQLVELGRAVGEQQVTGAPDWSTMEQESFTEWRANSSLSRLYYHSTSSE
jgi:2-polyprenyl-6-methoxyphenol hydroxylase-like FAD-dependent oxidoreductase